MTSLPLISHADPEATVACRRGRPVRAREFLADVAQVAAALPERGHIVNPCTDRYRFAVVLCASLARGQVSLLPPAHTPEALRQMADFAADAYYAVDGGAPPGDIGLPCVRLPSGPAPAAAFEVPAIDGRQLAALVFTSGSTGEPRPNAKTWGALVADVRSEAVRLGIGPGHAILGTVPPQHMYGFESTVLMPLQAGAMLAAERPFYPADISAALAALPRPRTLFITPFHLRAWLEAADALPALDLVVSATAPLSPGLAELAETRLGAPLLEIYGSTETGQLATRRPTASPEWDAFPGIELILEAGQAWAAGGHIEGRVALADVVEPTGPGRFVLHGRSADMVNIAGKRSSLGYLNHQLQSIEGVEDGAFFMPDDGAARGVTRLAAVVVAPALSDADIRRALRRRIDAAFLPRPLVRVAALPRNATGKLPREALAALLAAHRVARGRQ